MKKVIAINLGNKGVILSLRQGNTILDQLFLEVLNHDNIDVVNNFFHRNSKCNTYIILDTVAQNYNYKIFPHLNYFDLIRIANRRFENEIPKNDLKYKKFLYKNKVDKKSVYLFVSASTDSPLKEWLSYFETIKNNLLGIYMIPLEMVDFTKQLLISSGMKNLIKTKNKWILITLNNKVSDLRQIVMYNNNLAFTRLISLDATTTEASNNNSTLGEVANNDIIRTSEYIKRFDADFTFDKLVIITVGGSESKKGMQSLKVENAKILFFTVYEAAKALKLGKKFDKAEEFSDLLLDAFIFKNRHKVRFSNKKINIIFHLTVLANFFKKLVVISFLICFVTSLIFTIISIRFNSKISFLQKKLENNKIILQSKSKEEFGMESKEVDKIVDVGSIRDIININYINPMTNFNNFYKAQGDLSLTYDLKWALDKFDYQNISDKVVAKITYNVGLLNPDGNANKLFTKYDELNSKLRSIFKNELISITKMPTDINFDNKYYTYPIKIDITEGK
ncbi:MAG: hypothetical protein PHY80_03460 [Rickettsiales bacterium]|nr:hypothetical protein [Rickettsiales bacterium]